MVTTILGFFHVLSSLAIGWLLFLVGWGVAIHLRRDCREASRGECAGSDDIDEIENSQRNEPAIRFAMVIPAHDEGKGIAQSVRAALAMDYPRRDFRVVVIADNCSDDTAAIAMQAGAEVIVRRDDRLRGKGYALRHAFDLMLSDLTDADCAVDAIVVMDADSRPSPGLLACLSGHLSRGSKVMQVQSGILNREVNALTWLQHVGNVMENDLFHKPKARLGLPTVLRGTGMCFAAGVLLDHPWCAYSIAEDTEYTLQLLVHGIRVEYVPDVWVRAESASTLEQLRMQRQRWASGNAVLARSAAAKLITRGLFDRDVARFDAGLSLALASRPTLLLAVALPTLLGAVLGPATIVWWGGVLLAGHAAVFLAAVLVAGLSWRKLRWLVSLPILLGVLIVHAVLGILGVKRSEWVRTKR